jgi:hypothetical protein
MRWFVIAALLSGCTQDQCTIAPDQDGDGHNAVECGGDDCDDTDANRYPGNNEICDGGNHDEDCDLLTFGFRDDDADSYVDQLCCNVQTDGHLRCGNDCNDRAPSIHPDATEACNGIDDNCNGLTDEGVLMSLYADADHDGYGTGAAMQGCFVTQGMSFLSNDCDDANPAIGPGSMICASSTAYQICDQQGQYGLKIACPNQAACRTEPNGTGVCL